MKHRWLLIILIFIIFTCNFACSEKSIDYGYMTIDESISSGLSFSYDQTTHTGLMGGEGQVIYHRDKSLFDGYDEGNYVGIKLFAGRVVDDLESGSVKINDKTYNANQYLKTVNGDYYGEGHFLVKVEKIDLPIKISIKWNEKMKEQKYFIVIRNGTILQDKTNTK